jgi:regulator of sirC expression with transglutaminase-like and TPR domain
MPSIKQSIRFLKFIWLFILIIPLYGRVEHDLNASKSTDLQLAKRDSKGFENLTELIKPSIVIIDSVDRIGREGGKGTGFVVSADGIIATNFHVIGEHRKFKIRFKNGKSYSPVSILALDRENDLALIKIDAQNLPYLNLGDSDEISPGQSIFSIGNPLGFSHSVSRGVIAAIRELELGDGRPLVQVAIPIEPGSSGSPTLDLDGKVVAILAIKSGGAMGFGIPVNKLKDMLQNQTPIPIKKWLTIGALNELEWKSILAGTWKQRAGVITASGLGSGFGGRMLCLSEQTPPKLPYELEVEVRLSDEGGAAGLVFNSDGENKHYGFYPTNGSLRLTCFEGKTVYSWRILNTVVSSAYRPEQWNRLRVKIEKGGKITCYINGKSVIQVVDQSLKEGKFGLCKFRSTTAEFRNFRFAEKFPSSAIPKKTKQEIKRIVNGVLKNENLSEQNLKRLLEFGPIVPNVLLDHASELQKQITRLKSISKEIKERHAIEELANSLVHNDESSVDLLRSALLISRLNNQNFDLKSYLTKTENMAKDIASYFPQKATGEEKLKILVFQLFKEMGYHGSTLDYNHPSNSYINEVIDDREGLPITLSVLFIELANRLELPVSGLGIPGHFLAMYRDDSDKKSKEIIIDPFGGKIITRDEASIITGLRLNDKDFVPASKRDIITRMLRNLIHTAESQRNSSDRLLYINAILAIDPTDSYTRALRAMIHYGEGQFQNALKDINNLISENPNNPEMAPLLEIRNRLIEKKLSP